jgi:hypothetical protein
LTLYERAPVRFWQAVAGRLGLTLAASLWWRQAGRAGVVVRLRRRSRLGGAAVEVTHVA